MEQLSPLFVSIRNAHAVHPVSAGASLPRATQSSCPGGLNTAQIHPPNTRGRCGGRPTLTKFFAASADPAAAAKLRECSARVQRVFSACPWCQHHSYMSHIAHWRAEHGTNTRGTRAAGAAGPPPPDQVRCFRGPCRSRPTACSVRVQRVLGYVRLVFMVPASLPHATQSSWAGNGL